MFKYSLQQKTKLGKIINFSFPPVETCVQNCSYCYAKQFYRQYPTVKKRYNENRNFILKNNYFPDLPKSKNKIVRWNVSGDFFKPIVLFAFIDLVKRYPGHSFFGFTKTWKDKNFHKPLKELNSFPNINLFLSVDSQTGFNYPKGFNLAITSKESRKNFKGKRFKICNHVKNKINCDTCLICVTKRKNLNIIFPIH